MGMGLGYVDVPLLASALLSETPVWIEDKKLKEAARKLNGSYN
jgi:predicted nucleic acid-binding protein